MGQQDCTRKRNRSARGNSPGATNWLAARALRQAILRLREMELAEFAKNAWSPLGLRTASLRTELVRVERGLPLRPDSIARVLTGLQLIVPVRQHSTSEIPEAAA